MDRVNTHYSALVGGIALILAAVFGGDWLTQRRVGWLIPLLVILGIIGIGFGVWGLISDQIDARQLRMVVQPPITFKPVGPSQAGTLAVRKPCKLRPKELLQLYSRGATELQATYRVARYKGTWREVSATVTGVEPGNEVVTYVTCTDPDGVHVSLFFSTSMWANRLRKFKPNDPIAAIGRVDKVTQTMVLFDNCELL